MNFPVLNLQNVFFSIPLFSFAQELPIRVGISSQLVLQETMSLLEVTLPHRKGKAIPLSKYQLWSASAYQLGNLGYPYDIQLPYFSVLVSP